MKGILLGILLFQSSFANSIDFTKFYEKLTSSKEDWNPEDFGSSVSQHHQKLLGSFAPDFFIDSKSCAPMDYYQQYLPLLRFKGEKIERGWLKKTERNFDRKLKMSEVPDCLESENPPLYSYAWKEEMIIEGKKTPITILKYSFSFAKSGLPIKQTFFQKLGRVLGSSDLWHHLDIHGASFFLLDEREELRAIVLAQHNHFRSFVIGKEIKKNQKIEICFSLRSNEPYLCPKKTSEFPTAPTFQYMRWIVTGVDRPFLGAWDIVPGYEDREKLNYKLEFLPDKDPLITSWAGLGPNLKIWGFIPNFFRDSPPGMAIYNSPKLKPVWKTAQYFYFDPSDEKTFSLHEKITEDFFDFDPTTVFNINSKYFEAAWRSYNKNDI